MKGGEGGSEVGGGRRERGFAMVGGWGLVGLRVTIL